MIKLKTLLKNSHFFRLEDEEVAHFNLSSYPLRRGNECRGAHSYSVEIEEEYTNGQTVMLVFKGRGDHLYLLTDLTVKDGEIRLPKPVSRYFVSYRDKRKGEILCEIIPQE